MFFEWLVWWRVALYSSNIVCYSYLHLADCLYCWWDEQIVQFLWGFHETCNYLSFSIFFVWLCDVNNFFDFRKCHRNDQYGDMQCVMFENV